MFVNLDQEAVIRSAFEMPALPQSTVRLASLVADGNAELSEVVQVIEYDPALTLKLLRVANSVFSSPNRQVGTVKDAVVRLGTGAILGLAVGSGVQPNIVKVIPGYNIAGTDFWRHSLAAAMAAESLKTFAKARLSPLSFTAALLHDIGKVVLGNYLDAEILGLLEKASHEGRLAAFRAETEILSLHHGEVGGVVAQHWGLPETVVKGIAFHHDPEACDELVGVVTHFANFVAHEVAPTHSIENIEPPAPEQVDLTYDLEKLGLAGDCVSKITQSVRERLAAITGEYA